MSVSKFIESFFIGGLSLIIIILSLLFKEISTELSSIAQNYIYAFGVIFVLVAYQPHFVATYKMAYSYKIKSNFLVLVLCPLILTILLVSVIISEYLTISSAILPVLKVFLVLTLIGAGLHFSKQAYGIFFYSYSQKVSHNFKKFVKYLFILTSIYGLLNFISLNNGQFELFSLSLSLPFKIDLILSFSYYIIIACHGFLTWSLIKNRASFISYIVYFSFVSWYINDYFTANYFYLIPVFHSIQFIPFFFKRSKQKRKIFGWLGLVMISLIGIFFIPNFVDLYVAESLNKNITYIFVTFLLCINLHHFAMENMIWSKVDSKS